MDENEIGSVVVDICVNIHRDLGPGLLESVYESVLKRKLEKLGLKVDRQVPVSIEYDGEIYSEGFRADLIIENKVILELKSVEKLNNAYKKQLLTYLKLTDMRLGFLLNFGEELMKNGIVRTINGRI